jgi:FkbH-like protein
MMAVPETPPATDALRIVVAANFTAEPIREVLTYWLRMLDIDATLTFAPYNQLLQQVIDPASALASDTRGLNVLLVRPDLMAAAADVPERALTLIEDDGDNLPRRPFAETLDPLIRAIDERARAEAASWIVVSCPPVPPAADDSADTRTWQAWEDHLAAGLTATPGLRLIRAQAVLQPYGVEAYYDEPGHRIADIPYTGELFAALGTRLARTVHGFEVPPRKVIVLDCDHTLWSGVCGEDDLDGLTIDAPRRHLQEFVLDRMQAGALLCLCSRNEPADVWRVFDEHPGMRLRRDHLAAWRIDWQDKSHNLRALADELQVGLDTFILIDDDPAVCAEVEARVPQVVTVQLPTDPTQIPPLLDHIWAFDLPPPTEADRGRTEQYRRQRERQQASLAAVTPADFERALDVRVQIRPVLGPELARIAQLTYRTTQFNCTLQRRSEPELAQRLARGDDLMLAVHAADRFGDYGLVGAIVGHTRGTALIIDTLLLSCRALGRNVERHMLQAVTRHAETRGHATVRLPFVPGVRNAVARLFLDSCAPDWSAVPGDDQSVVYVHAVRTSAAMIAMPAAGAAGRGESD